MHGSNEKNMINANKQNAIGPLDNLRTTQKRNNIKVTF